MDKGKKWVLKIAAAAILIVIIGLMNFSLLSCLKESKRVVPSKEISEGTATGELNRIPICILSVLNLATGDRKRAAYYLSWKNFGDFGPFISQMCISTPGMP